MFITYLVSLLCILQKQYKNLQEGIASQLVCGGALLSFRIIFMGSKPPDFAPADNPAADSDYLLTRTLTFSYLPAVNLWMLLWPHILSFDWSMESIPLVTSLGDPRNLATVIFYSGLCATGYFCMKELDVLHEIQSANRRTSKHNANYLSSLSSHKMNGKMNGNGHANGFKYISGKGDYFSSNGSSTTNGNGHVRYDGLRKRSNSKNPNQNGHVTSTASNQHYKINHRTRHLNVVITSIAFMVFSFIPASNLFFYVGFVVAERILYIPSVGFCLLVTTAIDQLRRKLTKSGKNIVVVLVIVQLLMYSSRTVLRNWDWHSEETLYRAGIHVNPAKGENI